MHSIFRSLISISLIAVLSGCGFHLRGYASTTDTQHPFNAVYLDATNKRIEIPLRARLATQPNITLLPSRQTASTVLVIDNEAQHRELLTLNRTGHIHEYKLLYRVNAHLEHHHQPYGEAFSLLVQRDFPYSDSSVLGKEQEEQLVWQAMREEAVTLLLYRLSALKPPPPSNPTAAHAQPTH